MSELRSARSLTPAERTALFNAAYEGYLVPFHVDERQLAFMDAAFDLDLDASRIAFGDGEPVGLAISACAARTPGLAASASWRASAARASARR